jgi:mRNA-degrading endonuclease RelE of RelBE toxin-antitoxin system
MRYRIEWEQLAFDDLELIDPFHHPIIHRQVRLLADQWNQPSRNRRPLAAAVLWCPEATWQLRVGAYRVLYSFEAGVVRVLRIKWKSRLTTEEMGK